MHPQSLLAVVLHQRVLQVDHHQLRAHQAVERLLSLLQAVLRRLRDRQDRREAVLHPNRLQQRSLQVELHHRRPLQQPASSRDSHQRARTEAPAAAVEATAVRAEQVEDRAERAEQAGVAVGPEVAEEGN
jgi:hypothetical protein